jgi:multiple sugar transport system substrate-binding protein
MPADPSVGERHHVSARVSAVVRGLGRGRRAAHGLLAAGLLLSGGALAACDSGSSGDSAASGPSTGPSTSATTTSPATANPSVLPRVTLRVGVFGTPDEVAAYQLMAAQFAPLNSDAKVKIVSWPDHTSMMDDLKAGAAVPDVFLASRQDLLWLQQHRVLQPVDSLLDDRAVDFGDDYSRDSLSAFAVDNHLECLPYGVSPEVIFYNKKLVKFDEMKSDPPVAGQNWSLDQFAATARWAVRHHPKASGLYVDPTMTGIEPFLYSGGGALFDNTDKPTSTAFSTPASQSALATALGVVARPRLTLSQHRLLSKTPLEWFERGRLALMEGNRSMVPVLRQVLGINFDVMPMPSLGGERTVGAMTGMCIARRTKVLGTAADFLVQASSEPLLSIVADAGYLQPANQAAALSDGFQQPGRLPVHANVFTNSVRAMVIPPLIDKWQELGQELDPYVAKLFTKPPARIPALTRAMDQLSLPLLQPTPAAGGSPSQSAGG